MAFEMFTGLNFTLPKPSTAIVDCFRLDMFSGLVNSSFTIPNPSSSMEEIWYAAAPVALLVFTCFVYLISFKKKKKVVFEEDNDEIMLEADGSSSQNKCKICLEKQDAWKMFRNSTCSHSFCHNCTTKHATKMQQKHKTNACPGINCTSTLDIDALRLSLSRNTLVEWYEFVYGSMIRESLKLYCPFSTCSVLPINDDTNSSIRKTDCQVCQRSFCATCRIPWHSEFRCKEDDEMVKSLAKKLRVVRI